MTRRKSFSRFHLVKGFEDLVSNMVWHNWLKYLPSYRKQEKREKRKENTPPKYTQTYNINIIIISLIHHINVNLKRYWSWNW